MLALKLAAGVLWTIAYALIIRRSALDRATGMPMTALCINISWELYYAAIAPHPPPQLYVNWAWVSLDFVIFAQFVKYGRDEINAVLSPRSFFPILGFTLVMAYFGVVAMGHDLHDPDGMYSAFLSNMLMSFLFIQMLLRRGDLRGQSLYIALSKLAGTFCVCIVGHVERPERWLLYFSYVGILVFDVVYAVLLARRARALGINPWRRV
jgi:hypothetical protein